MARTRPTTAQRGYGPDHEKRRAQLEPLVDAGAAWCMETICKKPTRWIRPGTAWDLAHNDAKTDYKGPAHAECNRADGGRRSRRKTARPAPAPVYRTSRDW